MERRDTLPFNLLVSVLTGEESGVWGAKHPAEPTRSALRSDQPRWHGQGGLNSPDDSLDALHLPVILAGAESIHMLLHRLAAHPTMALDPHIN